MIYAFIVLLVYLVVAARMSGGGFGADILDRKVKFLKWEISFTWLPEVMFALPFAATASMLTFKLISWLSIGHASAGYITIVAGVAAVYIFWRAWVWSFLWMETGHGIWLRYGDPLPESDRTRRQTLSPVIDWLADLLGVKKTLADGFSPTVAYCWLGFGVKGFLIGLPALGLPLIVLWPFCYQVGAWLRRRGVPFDPHAFAECLTGVAAAVVIGLTWAVVL